MSKASDAARRDVSAAECRGYSCASPKGSVVFGARVAQRRVDLGITQRELAARIGVHPTYLRALERDRRRPSEPVFATLCETLGLDRAAAFEDLRPVFRGMLRTGRKPRPDDYPLPPALAAVLADEKRLAELGVPPAWVPELPVLSAFGELETEDDYARLIGTLVEIIEP